MMKKAQAALEFLMTYGWAILVVLIAISALAYFGVLNPDKFLPETCVITPGLTCLSHKATSDTFTVVIQNNLGQDITVTEVAVSSCDYTSATSMNEGSKNTFSLSSCSLGSSGSKFKSDLNFTYRDEELVYHTRNGEVITKVE